MFRELTVNCPWLTQAYGVSRGDTETGTVTGSLLCPMKESKSHPTDGTDVNGDHQCNQIYIFIRLRTRGEKCSDE